mgnify:CR=1 FL=1
MDQHLGGKEVIDGETVQWNADWQRGAVKFTIDQNNTPTVATDSQAYSLYSTNNADVYYRVEEWTHDYGSDKEYTYYNASGEMLGTSYENSGSWTDGDGNTISYKNTSYNDANWNWLGSAYEEKDGDNTVISSGTNSESVLTSSSGQAWTDLIAEFTWLQNQAGDGFSFNNTTVKVQVGTATWKEGNTTVTEEFKHLFSENWEHLGGKDTRDGETTQYNANWERGASSVSYTHLTLPTKA